MKPIIIAFIALVFYSMFLGAKSIWYYWHNGERKTAVISLVMFILVPVLLYLTALIPEGNNFRLWLGAPVIIMAAYWCVAGFFMDGRVKALKKEPLKAGEAEAEKKPPGPKTKAKNIFLLIIGLLIWVYGAFWGAGGAYLNIILLCLSIFLCAVALSSLWRWRKF